MPRKWFVLMLALGLLLAFSGASFAQNDDDATDDDDDETEDGFFASTLEFTEPTALEANTQLLFTFVVTNNAVAGETKGDWINQVDLAMPSLDYVVDEEALAAPDPLNGDTGDDYEIDQWEVQFDPTTVTITWSTLCTVTSMNYGDIREGESLAFQFTATTDADATDGFAWVLYSDEENIHTGTAYIEGAPDDDDDTGDDDEDDDDDGCGC